MQTLRKGYLHIWMLKVFIACEVNEKVNRKITTVWYYSHKNKKDVFVWTYMQKHSEGNKNVTNITIFKCWINVRQCHGNEPCCHLHSNGIQGSINICDTRLNRFSGGSRTKYCGAQRKEKLHVWEGLHQGNIPRRRDHMGNYEES